MPQPRLADLVADAEAPAAAPCGPLPGRAEEGASGALAAELARLHAGYGDPDELLDALRESVLLVPTLEGGLRAATSGGVRWVFAFSDEGELARFAAAGGPGSAVGGDVAPTPREDVDYVTVHGWRLLDEVVPAVGTPAGVALDVAGRLPMLFPPVTGVVPDTAAVDVAAPRREDR
ncbi:hypothetical protein [Streptomyces sp. NPDC020983]|uniref:hypothetical protein n=1 Tax=Streptomyces sp. NPDC020983 TaxID=3365106 RepID=UPI00378AA788